MDGVFIHPSADVSSKAIIGAGTRIWHHCTVLARATIGKNCLLSQNVYMEGRSILGDRVKVKNNVVLYDEVVVEDDAFLGPCCVFTNVLTPRSFWPRKDAFLTTRVSKGATIGANAVIVCGVTIGEYAMVGAGAVVTRDVPDFGLCFGNPAQLHGYVCYCGVKLADHLPEKIMCSSCGSTYESYQGSLRTTFTNSYSK